LPFRCIENLLFGPFLQFPRDFNKDVLTSGIILGCALKVYHPLGLAELFSDVIGDSALQVRLVAHQHQQHFLLHVFHYFLIPEVRNAFETGLLGEIEHKDNCVTTSVVNARDGSEPLLASSIINRQSNPGRIYLEDLVVLRHSDCVGDSLAIKMLDELREDGRLANA
jgi:hypothetical protein